MNFVRAGPKESRARGAEEGEGAGHLRVAWRSSAVDRLARANSPSARSRKDGETQCLRSV